LAPNAVQLLAPLVKKQKRHYIYYVNRRVKQLAKQGLVQIKKDRGNVLVALSAKGRRELAYAEVKHNLALQEKQWDGKWRVVMFDIQEFKRGDRNLLRAELNDCGLVRLQNSVWITPYDCSQLINLLKIDIGLGQEVIYMTVDTIENDGWLKKEFNL
jgi:DNA-binding transcriptional regulator PaaX